MKKLKIFSGNSNRTLARHICRSLGIPLGNARVGRFSDGEIEVEIADNVRGKDVFVVQSFSDPVNDHIMEMLIMFDALRRASANSVAAVIPYYGYGRQDRKVKPRTPITAKLLADLLGAAGVNRAISVDLHAGQIQGFFNMPFDHLYAAPIFIRDMKKHFVPRHTVIVSPDAGGTERARAYSKRLGCKLAIVDKRRPHPNVAEVMNIIGEVDGKTAVILDDMVDTAGTLTLAAKAIMEKGATNVYAYATHAVLSGEAIPRLCDSPIKSLTVTNTIPLNHQSIDCGKVRALSIAPLLAEAIWRIQKADSVSSLFI
ncbi:MAG: ribose-phosphate pyrophosphokinase [Deltaproteobacteria bacterium]|nr:ribose-phosphate pyrophosphokinase [Deltaproteobacteria bacterium]